MFQFKFQTLKRRRYWKIAVIAIEIKRYIVVLSAVVFFRPRFILALMAFYSLMKQPTLGQRKMNSPFVVEAFNPLFCALHRWIRLQQEHGHVFTHVGQHMTTARIVPSHEYGYNYYGQVRHKFTRSKMSCLSKFIHNNFVFNTRHTIKSFPINNRYWFSSTLSPLHLFKMPYMKT